MKLAGDRHPPILAASYNSAGMSSILNWASSNAAALNLVFSAVVMAATVVYARLTASLVRETIRMRTAQTDPEVAAYLEHDEHSIGVIHLVI